MEERGLGTKATRADIIQKLYDRGYVYSNPPEPSETGIAMYKAFHEYVPRMATPEMTAELEQDMDEIAAGKTSKDEVLRISREMLHATTTELQAKQEDLAKQIWAGMDEDKFLGPCIVCEQRGPQARGRLAEPAADHRPARAASASSAARAMTATTPSSPDSCDFTRPLPGRGYELWRLEERCSICGETPRLTVKGFRGRPWKLCLNDDCPSMVEMREKRAEREAAKAAREAAKAAGGDGAGEDGKAEADAGDDGARRARGAMARAAPPQAVTADGAHQARRLAQELKPRGDVFITLEGIDRSGKTTQARAARASARRRHRCWSASPAAPRPGSGSATLLADPAVELDADAPSCCCSAPRAPSSCER